MPRSDGLNAAALVSVAATGGVALWGYAADPTPGLRWLFLGGLLPALWALVQIAQERGRDAEVGAAIMSLHKWLIVWAGLMLSSKIGLRLAIHDELLSPSWLVAGQRINGLFLGVGLILFGNYLPTLRSPWRLSSQPFAWQQVHRFVGWVCVLGGLGVVACTVLLPLDSARQATAWIVAAVGVVSVARKFGSLTAHAGLDWRR
ncbi:MAG: hypothetical protein ACYC2K_02415 [Gemmatimonadales bacterium]